MPKGCGKRGLIKKLHQGSSNWAKKVLLLPISDNKLLAKWQGPYEVVRQMGPMDCVVKWPGVLEPYSTYYVNLLKEWHKREALWVNAADCDLGLRLENSVTPSPLHLDPLLAPEQ